MVVGSCCTKLHVNSKQRCIRVVVDMSFGNFCDMKINQVGKEKGSMVFPTHPTPTG